MKRVVREQLFVELATVPSKDKELEGANERLDTLGETADLVPKPSEIMARLRVHPFHMTDLALVGHRRVFAGCIKQGLEVASSRSTITCQLTMQLVRRSAKVTK